LECPGRLFLYYAGSTLSNIKGVFINSQATYIWFWATSNVNTHGFYCINLATRAMSADLDISSATMKLNMILLLVLLFLVLEVEH